MVGNNWFLPEKYRSDGTGYPLAKTTSSLEARDLTLYGPQQCAALIREGEPHWTTTLEGSGLFLFGIAPLPVTIVLPGEVEVTAEVALRPVEWRRGFADGLGGNSLVTGDRALWLLVKSGGLVVGEAWMEWVGLAGSYDAVYPFQLACGWHGPDGLESVYAHMLPFHQGRSDTTSPSEDSRSFGIGASLNVPLHGVYPGPQRTEVRAQSPLNGDSEYFDQPCLFFTGHRIPLATTLEYKPDGLSVSQRVDAKSSDVFGVLDYPACGAVGNPQCVLSDAESDGSREWSFECDPIGPIHLGSLSTYPYSDHAVVPSEENEESNISAVPAENERLARLRVKWTYPKRLFFGFDQTWSQYLPAGDFFFESNVEYHGAWCEWSTHGLDSISMSASTSVDGYSVDLTGLSISISICRHFTADTFSIDDVVDVETKDYFELRFSVLVSGRRKRKSGDDNLDFDDPREWQFGGRVYLNDGDVAKIFAGQIVTISQPYTDGRGSTANYWLYGVLEIQGIGRS